MIYSVRFAHLDGVSTRSFRVNAKYEGDAVEQAWSQLYAEVTSSQKRAEWKYDGARLVRE